MVLYTNVTGKNCYKCIVSCYMGTSSKPVKVSSAAKYYNRKKNPHLISFIFFVNSFLSISIHAKAIPACVQFSLQSDKEPYFVIAIYAHENAISLWTLSIMASEIHSPSHRYNIFGSYPTFTLKLFSSS